jgi:DNA-binding response OmpR family regulator
MLQLAGYHVIGASAGRQALSVTQIPTVIILDVNLPDLSGFDLCRMFRGRVETAGVPIVFLSSTFRNSSAKQLAEFVEANEFLYHPSHNSNF